MRAEEEIDRQRMQHVEMVGTMAYRRMKLRKRANLVSAPLINQRLLRRISSRLGKNASPTLALSALIATKYDEITQHSNEYELK